MIGGTEITTTTTTEAEEVESSTVYWEAQEATVEAGVAETTASWEPSAELSPETLAATSPAAPSAASAAMAPCSTSSSVQAVASSVGDVLRTNRMNLITHINYLMGFIFT